jgi:hypothetical protein
MGQRQISKAEYNRELVTGLPLASLFTVSGSKLPGCPTSLLVSCYKEQQTPFEVRLDKCK